MLRERLYPAAPEAGLFEACYGPILAMIVVAVVVVMLLGVFAMEFAMALIMPMHPMMAFPPTPGYPHPFIATVPIARTIGIIRPITHLDRDPDCHSAWPDKHANRQESHCKNRKFRFHNVITCSYEGDSLAASLFIAGKEEFRQALQRAGFDR